MTWNFLSGNFTYKALDEMVQVMYISKNKTDINSILSPIMNNFDYFEEKVKEIPKDANKEQVKVIEYC